MRVRAYFLVTIVGAGCGARTDVYDLGAASGNTDAGVGVDASNESAVDSHLDQKQDMHTNDSVADVPADVQVSCMSQDANPDGDCATELPGIKWTGAHCEPLGSGCSCKGVDCGALYPTIEECAMAQLACYPSPCEPQPVAGNSCMDCDTDSFIGVAFNGKECKEWITCGCAGAGCSTIYKSMAECATVTKWCDNTRCLATGGKWFPATAGLCGFQCGGANPIACELPFADCLCPTGQTLVHGTGCAPDSSCKDPELCYATDGKWHPASDCYCGFECGSPGKCQACLDSCDCGPARNFVSGQGCKVDSQCSTSPKNVCTSTGGTWIECTGGGPCSCGDYNCGIPNTLDPCVMPGCDCGPLRNFFADQGCTYEQKCVFAGVDAACLGGGLSSVTCSPGLACCGHCGAYPGCSTCDVPCCPSDPGCNDGCYPPPP